jgi:RHS repeat-associated protein
MPDRTYNSTALRYTFNGKEDEIFSEWQDYGFRNYDKRQRRFTSIDPLTGKYPWYTPYQFAGNKVIQAVDLDGLEDKISITQDDGSGSSMIRNDNHEEFVKRYTYFRNLAHAQNFIVPNLGNSQYYGGELIVHVSNDWKRLISIKYTGYKEQSFETKIKGNYLFKSAGLGVDAEYSLYNSNIGSNKL